MGLVDCLKILRPLNCAIAGIAGLIGFWIASGAIVFSANAGLAFIAVFLICGAGQAVNDFYDLETDRKKSAKKSLVEGKISAGNAFWLSLILFAIGIIIAWFLGLPAFAIALITSILLFAYSAFLGKLKFAGNWIVALGSALPLVFGAAVIGNFEVIAWLFWPMLFASYARELIKDLEDLKSDEGFKKTLPMIAGIKAVKLIAGLAFALAILIAFYAFGFGIVKSLHYLLFVLLTAVIFLLSARSLGKNNFSKAQSYAKTGMLLALIAYLAVLF